MKAITFSLLIIVQVFGYLSCTKDDENLPAQPAPTKNTAPKVKTIDQVLLILPNNEITLVGNYTDSERNVREVKWIKISGPASYRLENPNSLSTRLDQLEKGDYLFELRVTDSLALYGSDTVKVTVSDTPASSNELVFTDHTWVFDWSNHIEVEKFNTIISPNAVFKVYIRRESSSDWIEATPLSLFGNSSYEYFVETRPDGGGIYHFGSLYISYYGNDVQ